MTTPDTASGNSQKNVFGEELETCSLAPRTGFYRTGCCETDARDHGVHTICCEMTEEFLTFSKSMGNDLSTPRPEYGFAGLKPGDRWCVCAMRWKEAFDAGKAPKVVLRATNAVTLDMIPFDELKSAALDLG